MPAWEQTFPTKREANAFAKKHKSFGDLIFEVSKIIPNDPPKSLMAVLAARGR
jgi:hypothetical protein